MLDRILERVARVAPGRIGAAIDELRPGLADGFGGPFNGQDRRVDAVREMFGAVPFAVVIETGTFRATTTRFLMGLTGAPIATIEINPRYYYYARRRLADSPQTSLLRGESPTVLRSLAMESGWSRNPAFFYLDAHWLENLPLVAELREISQGWREYAVLVDDFRVPDDPGYAYDDYGGGMTLDIRILAPLAASPLSVFWPAAASDTETGARRGWVVLATIGPIADGFNRLRGLRPGGTLGDVVDQRDE